MEKSHNQNPTAKAPSKIDLEKGRKTGKRKKERIEINHFPKPIIIEGNTPCNPIYLKFQNR